MKRLISKKHCNYTIKYNCIRVNISDTLQQILYEEYLKLPRAYKICMYKGKQILFYYSFQIKSRFIYIPGGGRYNVSSAMLNHINEKDIHSIMLIARRYYFNLMNTNNEKIN